MKDCKMSNIVVFEDGTYFNGVKGHLIRRTKNFKDAKTFGTMSDRDANYLKDYSVKWKIVSAIFTIKY